MKKFEGDFEDDQPVGQWRSWYEDGQLRKEENFSLDESGSVIESINQDTTEEDPAEPKVEILPEPIEEIEPIPDPISDTIPDQTDSTEDEDAGMIEFDDREEISPLVEEPDTGGPSEDPDVGANNGGDNSGGDN